MKRRYTPKLTREQKTYINNLFTQGCTRKEIVSKTGHTLCQVNNCLHGKRLYIPPKTTPQSLNTAVYDSATTDYKAKYLKAVMKLAQHGLIDLSMVEV